VLLPLTHLTVLAIFQGLAEWWPISSSGAVILASLAMGGGLAESYELGLGLHLASSLAALIVFRHRIWNIMVEIARMKVGRFTRDYTIATLVSLAIGFLFYKTYVQIAETYGLIALIILSLGLFATSFILFASRKESGRQTISTLDWIVTGVLQGIAVLPGFSRSGFTMGYLCLRGYSPGSCVEASLLLGIPALLAASLYNLAFSGLTGYSISSMLYAQMLVFIISLISADALVKLAKRLKLYYFTLLVAILALAGAIAQLLVG
jgi:undecaprenyl-diphosphatase